MNPRAKQFEADQRYASLRDELLRYYFVLRAAGMRTEEAWDLAKNFPVSLLGSTLRS